MEIIGSTATELWLTALAHIIHSGVATYPRGFICYELMNVHLDINMFQPIVTAPARKLGYRFLCAEAAWILNGDDRVETIAPYSKIISEFSDDGKIFFGSYGTKIVAQLAYVAHKLIADNDTRQAVLTIWRENPGYSRDIPCTISVQFLIRDGYLHCIDTMRSSDIWLGIPYDMFNFTMLSSYLILLLNKMADLELKLGKLFFNLGSFHLYKRDKLSAQKCLGDWDARKFTYPVLDPLKEWSSPEDLIRHLWSIAELKPEELTSKWCCHLAASTQKTKGETNG